MPIYRNPITHEVLNCCKVGLDCTVNLYGATYTGRVLSYHKASVDGLEYSWVQLQGIADPVYVLSNALKVEAAQ